MSKLKLYSATWCPSCGNVKTALMQQGIEYDLIDVDENPEEMDALVAKGIRGLPVLSVGEKLYVGDRGVREYLHVRTV